MRTGVRLAWVDMARGAALLGMVVYHGAWDLHAFGLLDTDPSGTSGWRVLGGGVAGLFLGLSGFGLSLAARQGSTARRTGLRLGRIAAAAALVTVATRWAVPRAPVWFGILHCIVATNILALSLRPVPTFLLLASAAFAWAAPYGLRGVVGTGWAWTGLALGEPVTLDFRPILPWLAPVLVGMAYGRSSAAEWRLAWLGKRRWLRPLAWAGYHSLSVYLLHQPIMIGILVAVLGASQEDAKIVTLRQPGQAEAFLRQCRDECLAASGDAELCASTCHCVLTTALSRPAGDPSRRSLFPERSTRSLDAAVAICRPAPGKQER